MSTHTDESPRSPASTGSAHQVLICPECRRPAIEDHNSFWCDTCRRLWPKGAGHELYGSEGNEPPCCESCGLEYDLREGDDVSRFCDPCAQTQLLKACNLLAEVLRKDREAILEMKSEAPWYRVPDDLADLHRRISVVIGEESPNAQASATEARHE